MKLEEIDIIPHGHKILVKPHEEDNIKTKIIVPEQFKEEDLNFLEVEAIGTGDVYENGNRVPFDIEVGDFVVPNNAHAVIQFKVGDKEKYVLNVASVAVIIRKKKNL